MGGSVTTRHRGAREAMSPDCKTDFCSFRCQEHQIRTVGGGGGGVGGALKVL